MRSQQVRALSVVEARDIRRRMIFALLASAAWLLMAIADRSQAHADGSPACAARTELGATEDEAHQLGLSVPQHAQYRAASDSAPACELEAWESEQLEDDASVHSAVVRFAPDIPPLAHCATQTAGATSSFWVAQFARSAALPRGPPNIRG